MSRRPAPRPNGTGSVRELTAGKKYQLRLPRIGGQPASTRTFHGTAAQARRALDDWITERRGGHMGRMPTVGGWAQQFLDVYVANRWAVSTTTVARWVVEHRIIDDPIGHLTLDELREHHVERWMMDRAKGGATAATIRTERKYLGKMLQWAVERRVIDRNPVRHAVTPGERMVAPPREVTVLTIEQARRLVAVCQDESETWGPFFVTAMLLGLRPGEVCALRWSDVDWDAGTIMVERAVKREGDRAVELGPLKAGERRLVEMPGDVRSALKRQRALVDEHGIVASDPLWEGLVFLRDAGTPAGMANVRQQLARITETAGLPHLTPYGLRHSCASILLEQGVREDQVARMLGTSIAMLRQHYRHHLDPIARGGGTWDEML